MKFSIFDVVTLIKDIPESNLKSGLVGTIIDIYSTPEEAYEVEFCDEEGRTIEMLALPPDKLIIASK